MAWLIILGDIGGWLGCNRLYSFFSLFLKRINGQFSVRLWVMLLKWNKCWWLLTHGLRMKSSEGIFIASLSLIVSFYVLFVIWRSRYYTIRNKPLQLSFGQVSNKIHNKTICENRSILSNCFHPNAENKLYN